MTSGLLSNFALFSLTTIRNNSQRLVSLFSKELDSAYLSHKSFLPNSEDAEILLVDIMKDSIAELLIHNEANKILDKTLLNLWLDVNIVSENHSVVNAKGSKLNPNIAFLRNKELLADLIYSEESNVEKKFKNRFKSLIQDKNICEEYLQFLSLDATSLFLNIASQDRVEEINKNFAKLTHHKSLFVPQNTEPTLTLGTVIKKSSEYYVCIQQKCDSVRIYNKERKFLFLPLITINGREKFDIITPDGVKLKLDKKSFSLRTLKFTGDNKTGLVKASSNQNGIFIFREKYDDLSFEWVFDLKDLHAQRIVSNYAAQLSRVGLNESEWLRRWGS